MFYFLPGTGIGLLYLPSVLAVNMYFHEKRTVAIGIAFCGAGAGTLVFSSLGDKLLMMYGWKGATWVLAGMVFNCVAFSSTYRPIESSNPSLDASLVVHKENSIVKHAYKHRRSRKTIDVEAISYNKIWDTHDYNIFNHVNEITTEKNNIQRERTWPAGTNTSLGDDSSSIIHNSLEQQISSGRMNAGRIIYEDKGTTKHFHLLQIINSVKSEVLKMGAIKNPALIIFACARFVFGLGKYGMKLER